MLRDVRDGCYSSAGGHREYRWWLDQKCVFSGQSCGAVCRDLLTCVVGVTNMWMRGERCEKASIAGVPLFVRKVNMIAGQDFETIF